MVVIGASYHTHRPSTACQVLNHRRHVASKADAFSKFQNKQNIVSVGKRCLILIPLLEIGIILTKNIWQSLANVSLLIAVDVSTLPRRMTVMTHMRYRITKCIYLSEPQIFKFPAFKNSASFF